MVLTVLDLPKVLVGDLEEAGAEEEDLEEVGVEAGLVVEVWLGEEAGVGIGKRKSKIVF